MRIALSLSLVVACAAPVLAQDGPSLYAAHCTRCHDAGLGRAPSRTVIAQLDPERIVSALESGTMRAEGESLSDAERGAIAVFLTGRALGSTMPPPGAPRCSDAGAPLKPGHSPAEWNGWGPGTANNRFQTADGAGLKAKHVHALRVRWAFGFAGDLMAAAQPAIVGGRVFVGSTSGRVYSLGLRTGCAYWTFDADATVRTAISVGPAAGRELA